MTHYPALACRLSSHVVPALQASGPYFQLKKNRSTRAVLFDFTIFDGEMESAGGAFPILPQ